MISPTKGRVVILQDPIPEQTGVILSPTKPTAPPTGRVVKNYAGSELSVGAQVHFGTFGHSVVTDPEDDVKYLVMDEENVIAVLTT